MNANIFLLFPALDGDVLYSARRFCSLQFAFDYSVLAELADYRALLQLYKLPYRNKDSKKERRRNRRRNRNQEPEGPEEARVTVYQVLDPTVNDQVSIRMLDTQWVVMETGKLSFKTHCTPNKMIDILLMTHSNTFCSKSISFQICLKFIRDGSVDKQH